MQGEDVGINREDDRTTGIRGARHLDPRLFQILALGGLVGHRARRADVTGAFLGFYLGAIAARVLWLGQRAAVFFHHLENGALLLFAFFMISDPMTIPNHARGRVAHAALVAAIAY